MNDQLQVMSQPPTQPVGAPPMMSQSNQVMSAAAPQMMMMQSQAMGMVPIVPPQMMGQSQMLNHSQGGGGGGGGMGMGMGMGMMMMMKGHRGYKPWNPQHQYQQQKNSMKFNNNKMKQTRSVSNNWKNPNRMMDNKQPNNKATINFNNNSNNNASAVFTTGVGGVGPSTGGGYNPPSLNELQNQNRMKARKYYHPKKKKFNNARFAPYAPRNTTSFIIRAKKAGGIAEMVSPCPVTPAVLPTPIFSPSREVLGDMAKEEWGVDGYGSMKGLIRLRSPPGNDAEVVHEDEEDEEGNGSSESDVEEHVEVERRLDHDLSRFEMIYPSSHGGYGGEYSYNNVLENRVDDQDTHIAQLEEENLTLKERLFLMERELGDLRRRMQFLERQQGGRHGHEFVVDVGEEGIENVSENDENENESDGGSDVGPTIGLGNNTVEVMEYKNEFKREYNEVSMGENEANDEAVRKSENNDKALGIHGVIMEEDEDAMMAKEDRAQGEGVKKEVGLVKLISDDIHKEEEDECNKIAQEKVVVAEKDVSNNDCA